MKTPKITITVYPDGNAVPEILWRGCIIRPGYTYTNATDAMRGARRALRRLGWVDLWTDTDRRKGGRK